MKRVVFAALALAAACGCAKKEDPAAAKPKGGRQGLSFAVDVVGVEAKKVEYVVAVPGVIDAFEHVQVTARVAGAVDRVAFTEGQKVNKGDVLVVIDSERYQLAVNGAKAALDKAKASQADSEAMVSRREGASTSHPGLIPGEELESYKTKSLTAKADTQVAAEALKTAELNLRDSYVRSPIEGVIQTRTVETGQYVQAGYVMATLLRSDPMLLRFQVEPSDAPRIKPGMTANFTMRETQKSYAAKISLVGGAADMTTHMVPVTAAIDDKEQKYWLRPGSFCDVTVDLEATRIAPVIPRLAARASDHGYIAFVVDGDTAHEHALTLGMNTRDGWVEVRSGLAAGDQLVVRGAEALSEGAKVRPNKVTAAQLAGDGTSGLRPAWSTPDAGAPDEAPRADARDAGGGGHRNGGASAHGGAP